MKKISTRFFNCGILSLLVFSFLCNTVFGQGVIPYSLGSVTEFKSSFSKVDILAKKVFVLTIENTKQVTLNISEKNCDVNNCYVFAKVEGHEQATFFIKGDKNNIAGKIIFLKTKEAYDIYTNAQGEVFIAPIDINKVICVDFPSNGEEEIKDGGSAFKNNQTHTTAIPSLNSLPGAYGTLYLDFDGENVSGGQWGTINAAPLGATDADITKIWLIVAEDYMPFNINVTTDRAVFNAAPTSQKQMVIFTPTNTASPGAGGTAHLNSWGTNDPCWSFGGTVKSAAESGSHEAGHTFNIIHDGTTSQAYYAGHNFWGPIMGACYNQYIVQWCKGDYANANNQEDDLAKISIKVPYRTDDAGNDITTTKLLALNGSGSGNVSLASNFGIIERTTDKDVFKFTTSGGNITLNLVSHKEGVVNTHVPNLDIQARLLNGSFTELVKANPTGPASGTVTITYSAAAGTYYLEIDGVGSGDPATTGYSDYGSLGQYFIWGTVPNSTGTAVNDVDNKYAINIFPNPSSGQFTINIPTEGNNESKVEIVNNLGQVVMTSSEAVLGNINKEINISGQPSGIYCVVVTSGNDMWKGKVLLK